MEIYNSNLRSIPTFLLTAGASEAPGSIDNDPDFQQIENAAFEAADDYNKNPSSINALTLMKTLDALNTYLGAHQPTKDLNPKAYNLVQDFAQKLYPGMTLAQAAQICAGGKEGTADIIDFLKSVPQMLDKEGNDNMYSHLYAVDNTYKDKDNVSVRDDLQVLMEELQTYRRLSKEKTPDAWEMNSILTDIGRHIQRFIDLDKAGPLSDGFLTVVKTFFTTPTPYLIDGKAQTLADLAAVVNSRPLPDQSALDDLQKALNSIGENNNDGGDLKTMLDKTLDEMSWRL